MRNETVEIKSKFRSIALAILLVLILSGCCKPNEASHSEDGVLVPVDWSMWIQPKLNVIIRESNLEWLKNAVEANPGLVHEKAANGSGSAIFEAVRLGNLEIVSYLVENGADVNESLVKISYRSPNIPELDMRGYSPIHMAAEHGNLEMVRLLKDLGADIRRTYSGKTALQIAEIGGYAEVADYLNKILNEELQP